jgi:hypothetical protein
LSKWVTWITGIPCKITVIFCLFVYRQTDPKGCCDELLLRPARISAVSVSRLWLRNRLPLPSSYVNRTLSAAFVPAAAGPLWGMFSPGLPLDFYSRTRPYVRYAANPTEETNGQQPSQRCLAAALAAILNGQVRPRLKCPPAATRRPSSAVVRTKSGRAGPVSEWQGVLLLRRKPR